MKINNRLNLVVPLETEDHGSVWVHSVPLRSEIFDKYYLVIAKTFAQIYAEGLNAVVGPRIAYRMLRTVAEEKEVWDTPDGVKNGLIAEIRRTSTVIHSSSAGWAQITLDTAVSRGILSGDDLDEALSAIVFFICASAIHRKHDLEAVLQAMGSLWETSTTLSNSTEYLESLPKSMPTEPLPVETVKQSSIPC